MVIYFVSKKGISSWNYLYVSLTVLLVSVSRASAHDMRQRFDGWFNNLGNPSWGAAGMISFARAFRIEVTILYSRKKRVRYVATACVYYKMHEANLK